MSTLFDLRILDNLEEAHSMRLDRLLDRLFGGHFTIGRITVYGRNAMHFAVNISTHDGYFCFRLPLFCFGRWWPLYAYYSPNATPWHHEVRGFGAIRPDDCVCDECHANSRGHFSAPAFQEQP